MYTTLESILGENWKDKLAVDTSQGVVRVTPNIYLTAEEHKGNVAYDEKRDNELTDESNVY